jgi:hypothetical protein
MAKNKNEDIKKKNLNRTPEESVTDAVSKSKTKVQPGLNGEIKDIVNDILKGNLKKVMSGDVTKKVGLKENEDKPLDETELILGGKSVSDGAGNDVIPTDVQDVTKGGKVQPAKQMSETEEPVEEPETEEDPIEKKLAEMGYGLENEGSIYGDEKDVEDLQDPTMGNYLSDAEAPIEEPVEEPVMDDVPVEEPIEAPVEEPVMDGEPVVDDEPIDSIEIKQMDVSELDPESQDEVKTYENEIYDIKDKLTTELEAIGESVLPKETQDKLRIHFEMLAEAKAKIIAKKQVATIVEKTNDYMEYVVKEFVETKEKEIKEAVESVKKAEIYENFKYLVEKVYGENTTNILEAKKTEEFLINVISEMKAENQKLETRLTESANTIKKMECKLIFNEMTKDVSHVEREKLAEFVATFDVKDTADFKSKLKMVKESFETLKSDKKKVATKSTTITENTITDAVKKQRLNEEHIEEIDPSIYRNIW